MTSSRSARTSIATVFACLTVGVAWLTACGSAGDTTPKEAASDTPERGGTLKLIGSSNVDHMSTTSSYFSVTLLVMRTFARQLVQYPMDADVETQKKIVADLATVLPSHENGGISADGKTYTFHLRRGVNWNTQPPRDVTAQDVERGMKMSCNPVSPLGAPGYYRATILGYARFCDGFAKGDATIPGIKSFLEAHEITGVKATDDSTIVFTLIQPTPDFFNLLAMNFASPWPVEYLAYLPDGAEFRTHTISNGPYQITSYVPNREIHLHRNPVWDAATDPLRHAYVDSIEVIEGINAQSVQQQLQAGTADLSWDQIVPTSALPQLIATNDPNLIIGPQGDNWAGEMYMPINMESPNERGALGKLKVRQALEWALDRAAEVQLYGGARLAGALDQAVSGGSSGWNPGYRPYGTPDDHGDPAKAKQLLAEAGYPNGLTHKLLYRTSGQGPQNAQTVQASFARAGITLQLIPATQADFYGKYMADPASARRGTWDLSIVSWGPDWYGNNGRSMIEALFDGRTIGPNSTNYGLYNNPDANRLMDKALAAPSSEEANIIWTEVAAKLMEDAALVPMIEYKIPLYHSSRVRNCIFNLVTNGCELASVWLEGGGGARRP